MNDSFVTLTERYGYLLQDDNQLMADCRKEPYQGSGPGGQHRNRNLNGVRLHHIPTGFVGAAVERRETKRNLGAALFRLRMELALGDFPFTTQEKPPLDGFQPKISIRNPKFAFYLLQAMHAILFYNYEVSVAAKALKVSTSSMLKFVKQDKKAWSMLQLRRKQKGLPPLK